MFGLSDDLTLRDVLFYLGPGFMISVAYMDPGNWATNITGGATYGTALLWVVAMASLMAIVIQVAAARLGIATGTDIARHCREHFPAPVVYGLWLAAEAAMIATDVAEILGAAIGFSLLLDFPLWAGAVLAAVASFALLGVRTAYRQGFRYIEVLIAGFVGVISVAFVLELILVNPDAGQVAAGLRPSIPDAGALYIAAGILGATVMPHSIYLHTRIVQDRRTRLIPVDGDAFAMHRRHYVLERIDTSLALFAAMFVNGAMLVVAAFALTDLGSITLEAAYVTLSNTVGTLASHAFALALVCAGLSSSLVATLSGQVVIDGFLDVELSAWVRRAVTLVPSLLIVLWGFDPTQVLVFSQVLLSLELPFVLIPLVYFVQHEGVMGDFRAPRATLLVLGAIVTVVLLLNVALLAETFGVV